MRANIVLAPAAALLFWALFFGGGQTDDGLVWLGGAALLLAAACAAAALDGRLPRPALGALGLGAVACLVGLVLWQGVSTQWSIVPDRSWAYLNRGLVYLGFLVVGMFVGAVVSRRAFANTLAGLLALVLGWSLLGKVLPTLEPGYADVARLSSPVGHPNALALLGVFALVLGLWRAAQGALDGTLLVFEGTLVVLLAYSRGGVVVAVVVAATWLALDKRRFESLVALALGGGAGAAVAAISLALPGITKSGQSHATRVHDGWLFLLAVVVAAAFVALASRRIAKLRLAPDARRRATLALFVVLALGGIAGIVGVAVHSGPTTNASPAGAHCAQGPSRFACSSSDARLDWWRASWRMFKDKPLEGWGAGSFGLAQQLRQAKYARPTTEPHNLALQVLGETGIVGFLLLVGAVSLAVPAVRRRVRGDNAALALAVCALAYLLHALVEIDWDFVAVSAPFFVVLGALLARPGTVLARREPIWAGAALVLAATAILSLAAPYVAEQKLNKAIATVNPALASQAHAWNPVSADILDTWASIEAGAGHNLKALQLYHEAIDAQPENPDPWIELGRFELDIHKDPCAAYRALNEAYTRNRFIPDVAMKGGPLDRARAKVNAGACGPA
jgi:hypothetical protein